MPKPRWRYIDHEFPILVCLEFDSSLEAREWLSNFEIDLAVDEELEGYPDD